MNAKLRNFALWVIIVLLLLALFILVQNPGQRTSDPEISFSQLLSEVDQGRVRDVLIQGPEIHGTFTDGRSFQTYAPNDPSLAQRLYDKGVAVTVRPQRNDAPWFVSLLVSWLPFIALIGVWIFLSRQMRGARAARAPLMRSMISSGKLMSCRSGSISCATGTRLRLPARECVASC
jgi:cell division protease FtsH